MQPGNNKMAFQLGNDEEGEGEGGERRNYPLFSVASETIGGNDAAADTDRIQPVAGKHLSTCYAVLNAENASVQLPNVYACIVGATIAHNNG